MNFFTFFIFIYAFLSWTEFLSAEPYSGPLTDEQFNLRDNFVHEGYTTRTKNEACGMETTPEGQFKIVDQKKFDMCNGQNTHSFLGRTGDSIIDGVAKMYGMFFSMTKHTYTDKKGATKEENDYCAFIPLGVESAAMATQSLGQQQIVMTNNDPSAKQLESLENAARSHGLRERTALMQTIGWGATSACYVAGLPLLHLKSGFKMDPSEAVKYTLKTAAAAFLTSVYAHRKIVAQKAKKATMAIHDDLKNKIGKGKCNPITERSCYCLQPETRYDVKYCVNEALKNRDQAPDTVTACVSSDLKHDLHCDCLAKNNCYDVVLDKQNSEFATGNAQFAQNLTAVKSLMRGNLDEGKLNSQLSSQQAAARSTLQKLAPIDGDIPTLTEKQKAEARALQAHGLPLAYAARFAAQPLTNKGQQFKSESSDLPTDLADSTATSGDSLAVGDSSARGQRENAQVLYFENNSASGRKQNSEGSPNLDFLEKMKKKQGEAGNSDQVLNFADVATREAQIDKNPQKSLFEILSNRYRTSTWQQFHVLDAPVPAIE